jgi:hypothetical protein
VRRFPRLPDRAIMALAILAAILLNVGFCYWFVQSNIDALNAQRAAFHEHNVKAAEVAAARGAAIEAKLCGTFESLYADKPPAGDPATNPSRAYLQELHERLGEVPGELGCHGGNDG